MNSCHNIVKSPERSRVNSNNIKGGLYCIVPESGEFHGSKIVMNSMNEINFQRIKRVNGSIIELASGSWNGMITQDNGKWDEDGTGASTLKGLRKPVIVRVEPTPF